VTGADERLSRAEELNERAASLNRRVQAASDPEEVGALLGELEEVAKQTTELLEEIRRDAGA
jgi:ABC-type transporter Mla subunit MlaD